LLAYLAIEAERPLYREALAGLLWPERPQPLAASSLRHALWDLRRTIGDQQASPPFLLISRDAIRLNLEADSWVDVRALEEATACIAEHDTPQDALTPSQVEALHGAVACYRGPFMEGFALGDSAAYEEWLLLERERLQRRLLLGLCALATHHQAHGQYDEALRYVRRAIEIEPWQEDAHERAMQLLVLTGRRGEALAQFRRCRDLMMRELGEGPGPQLTAFYESIRAGTAVAPIPARAAPGHADGRTTAPGELRPLLVAREEQMALLGELAARAFDGEGRVALVTGEAGSGKTALITAFAQQVLARYPDLVIALGSCSAHGGVGDAYEPFRQILRMLTGDTEATLGAQHATRIAATLPIALEELVRHGPDLTRLLAQDAALLQRARACAPPGADWPRRLSALVSQPGRAPRRGQQADLCNQMARTLTAIAAHRPLLLLLDDLQWVDPSSLDMLFLLGRHLQGSRILILGAYRDDLHGETASAGFRQLEQMAGEFRRLWGETQVDLGDVDARRFVDAYLDSWPNRLDAPFREALARHTGGNALFTVELLRSMRERGDLVRDAQGRWLAGSSLAWERVLPRVEGAISQRVGQLTAAQQELIEVASVEGEQFHAEVLARALGLSVQATVSALSGPLGRGAHLVIPQGLVRMGDQTLARYRFRHGLFQTYLYGRMDPVLRAHLHRAVGDALVALSGDDIPHLARQLARHYEAGGRPGEAARYLLKAGQHAAGLGAHREAIACYRQALDLAPKLPPTPERTGLEFELQMAVDRSLMLSHGWGAPERGHALERAYQLGKEMGWSRGALLQALRGMADLSVGRGDYARAAQVAQELLAAAERIQAPAYAASAHALLAMGAAPRGCLAEAWEHATLALDYCRRAPTRLSPEEMFSLRPHADVVAAHVRLLQGYPAQALHLLEQAMAYEWGAPHILAGLLSHVALHHALRHEDALARARAEEAMRLVCDEELLEVKVWSEVVLSWAEARAGAPRRGLERIQSAMAMQPRHSTLTFRYVQRLLHIEALLAAGMPQEAHSASERALTDLAQTGNGFIEADLWRLRAESLLQGEKGDAIAAEEYLQRGIAVARSQGARFWELRVTLSLAKLWAGQGRTEQARAALATVSGAFSERQDLPDLLQARRLLDSLES